MPLAASSVKSRLATTKSRQPIASSSSSSAYPTSTSIRSKTNAASAPSASIAPPVLLQLPPSLPTLSELQATHGIRPSPQLIARRLISLARSFLSLHQDSASADPLDWEIDLCSATFFSIHALCLDSSSTQARRTLARCARLGGFNIVLPFSPSGSAASASVSAASISSYDTHDRAGAQACIHILQQGSTSTFQDAGSAREYRDACRTLGGSSDAVQVADVLHDKVLGKRKAVDALAEETPLPQPISAQTRYHSQLLTDLAYSSSGRDRNEEARSSFVKALEQDPFNWRAWTGLCDTGYGAASASKHFGAATLDRLYSNLVIEAQAPFSTMEAALKSMPPFSSEQAQSSSMIRKVSEDGSNKKIKVSAEVPSAPALQNSTVRSAALSRPADKVTPSKPTTSASTVTATRLHPASRALSAAQTNTHHLEAVAADHDNVKSAKANIIGARPNRNGTTRTAAPHPTTTAQNARQLRSTAVRSNTAGPTARASALPSRAGATSQAGSVSSTSSGSSASSMSSRATVSTARTAVSARRVGTAAPVQAMGRAAISKPAPTSTARTASVANGSGGPMKRNPVTTAATRLASASSISRPGSAMSKASSTSIGGPSTASRANGTLATSRTAAEAMRQKEEETAKLKLEQLAALRGTALQQLIVLAHQHAADMYVLALLAQVGEGYRLLRLCEGGKAAALLLQPMLAQTAPHQEAAKDQTHSDGSSEEGSMTTTSFNAEATRMLDLQIQSNVLRHLLLARCYAECSQYASSESHFDLARKLNPYIASHMDIYSLVLFHLSREVKLSSLAQHLTMVAPGTASTHIVVGNAFSLQKEHQTALVCFQRAAAAAPKYAYAFTLAGHEAHDLGLHDEAIAYFRSAVRCDRRHWNAWAGLGRVYLGIGEHEHAACKSLQQAIAINPGNHILWDLVGWTFSLINAPAKALECYDRAIELAPSASVLTYLRRAELLLQHGDPESSHRDLVQAHDLAPEEASIHILLAQSYMRLGGGAFCQLEGSSSSAPGGSKASSALRATGTMVLPTSYQAEITHHLGVAIDLDPSLLRVVKSICEGYKTLPGSKLSIHHQQDLTAASFTQSGISYDQEGYSQEVDSQMHHSGAYGQQSYHSYNRSGATGVGNSTPHQHQMLVPADFASSHPQGGIHDSSSFLSMITPAHSANIVLEDAEVSH